MHAAHKSQILIDFRAHTQKSASTNKNKQNAEFQILYGYFYTNSHIECFCTFTF